MKKRRMQIWMRQRQEKGRQKRMKARQKRDSDEN
jgi:hypothetical protein